MDGQMNDADEGIGLIFFDTRPLETMQIRDNRQVDRERVRVESPGECTSLKAAGPAEYNLF